MTYLERLDETYVDFTQVHDCFEIYFCLENCLQMFVGGREYELSSGEFLLIMPGMPHNVVSNPSEKMKYLDVMFEWPKVEKGTEQHRPLAKKISKLASLDFAVKGSCNLAHVTKLLNKMEKEMKERDIGWNYLFRGFCLEFLIYCLREVIEPVTIFPAEMENINLAIKITKYMHNNYSEKITLKDVAEMMHVSSRQVQRIFKDFFGVSFNRALNLYRLNHAKNYLIHTDLTIDEVAWKVGLSSPQTLYKLFREQENMSIGKYRKREKERLRNVNYECS